MELGGSHRLACIDAKTLKAYSITVTLPLFMASLAFDRRTASADGYPSLIPSLPHSTTVEQPAAPFLPTPHSLAEVDIEETGTRRLEIDSHARDLRARLKLPVPELGYLLGPTPRSSTATHASQTSPPPTTTLSPLSTAPTPTPLTTTSTQPTTASPTPRRFR